MKNTLSIIALSVGMTAAPLTAQDKAERAVIEAAEAAAKAAEEAVQDAPAMIDDDPGPEPAPPAIVIPPPAPVTIQDRAKDAPVPVRYGLMRPTQADYPAASWAAGHEGRVRFELAVDAAGKPTDCTILDSSGHSELDDTTCRIAMERGAFNPQIDENDQPVAGTYSSSHYWRKREQEFPSTMRFKARFLLDEEGKASECEILAVEGELPEGMRKTMEREPCPFSRGSSRGPYRDENGVPVAKQVTVEFAVDVADPEPKAED